MLPMNPYYTGAAAAAAAANANMSPESAMSLLQAAMAPPPTLQGIVSLYWFILAPAWTLVLKMWKKSTNQSLFISGNQSP